MRWDAARYLRFEAERNRPILDLLAHVPGDNVARAADLGCGPGNSTEILAAHCPDARVEGVDNAPEMLAAARDRLPGVSFTLADVAEWEGPGQDLILANAVLQWLPDHERLLPRLLAQLSPDGRLAVQMPDNAAEPSHRLMREISEAGPWAAAQASARESFAGRRAPSRTLDILEDAGARVDLWRTTYYHILPGGPEAVVDWVGGTGLRPDLAGLDGADREAFLTRYRAAIAEAYPARANGTSLLAFPRLFILAGRVA